MNMTSLAAGLTGLWVLTRRVRVDGARAASMVDAERGRLADVGGGSHRQHHGRERSEQDTSEHSPSSLRTPCRYCRGWHPHVQD